MNTAQPSAEDISSKGLLSALQVSQGVCEGIALRDGGKRPERMEELIVPNAAQGH